MDVTVVCYGVMRDFLPQSDRNKALLTLPETATVQDLLEEMGAPSQLVHVCLLDGRRVGLEEALTEGAEVTLMPPFSGGSPT
jgi:molybdopterin converting factor small subunit